MNMERIDADLFYDRGVVGASGATKQGHRGIGADWFFRREDPVAMPHFLHRVAAQPWKFAAVVFGFGFFAVFIRQADIWFQIILGAPIFEEMVKFGLALLLANGLMWLLGAGRLRHWTSPWWLLLRLPLALVVGAGFGFMEHYTTYASEDASSYFWRVMFHGLSGAASMIAFQAVLPSPDLRVRWLAMVPSIFLHYVNNYGAVILGVGSLAVAPLGVAAEILSTGVVMLLAAIVVLILVAPRLARSGLGALARRLPEETKEA